METLFWDELESCVRMEFNDDISQWNISKKADLYKMFEGSVLKE